MPKINCDKLGEKEYSLWDEFVNRVPTGKIFHTTQWLQKVADRLEVWVVTNSQGNIIGGVAVPIMIQKIIPRSAIPPLTPYSGPIIDTPKDFNPYQVFKFQREVLKKLLPSL
ncbi:MAG: hypothetical protein ACK4OO_08345, partial [bacterium]